MITDTSTTVRALRSQIDVMQAEIDRLNRQVARERLVRAKLAIAVVRENKIATSLQEVVMAG